MFGVPPLQGGFEKSGPIFPIFLSSFLVVVTNPASVSPGIGILSNDIVKYFWIAAF